MTDAAAPVLIAGNWKMNRGGRDAVALAADVAAESASLDHEAVELLVCPPATAISSVGEALRGSHVALGGQDCHMAASGAHTGDIAAAMLLDVGCRYVIVGHSERRTNHAETDETVRAKAEAAIEVGLIPIVCIGETEAERDSGATLDVLSRQIAGSVPAAATPAGIVLAYEPVWAIGTGRTAEPDQVAEAHAHIRSVLSGTIAGGADVRLLYGGSVKPGNAAELMVLDAVNGALVGGASLKSADFIGIATAAIS